MARRKKNGEQTGENVVDYRHKGVKGLNIPPAGRIAVKVIDPRGNEVMRVHKIGGSYD